jgi:hypothetical protein
LQTPSVYPHVAAALYQRLSDSGSVPLIHVAGTS